MFPQRNITNKPRLCGYVDTLIQSNVLSQVCVCWLFYDGYMWLIQPTSDTELSIIEIYTPPVKFKYTCLNLCFFNTCTLFCIFNSFIPFRVLSGRKTARSVLYLYVDRTVRLRLCTFRTQLLSKSLSQPQSHE